MPALVTLVARARDWLRLEPVRTIEFEVIPVARGSPSNHELHWQVGVRRCVIRAEGGSRGGSGSMAASTPVLARRPAVRIAVPHATRRNPHRTAPLCDLTVGGRHSRDESARRRRASDHSHARVRGKEIEECCESPHAAVSARGTVMRV